MKNFVVCGPRDIGKTTLIKRIMSETDRTVYGFFTQKFPEREIDGLCPIYMYKVGTEPVFDDKYLIGCGGQGNHYINTEVFDEFGVECITVNDTNALIIMDEVGFLELEAKKFQAKVIECLKGSIPTVVMMKQKLQYEFMQTLKALPEIEYIDLNEDNRDAVFEHIMDELKRA